MYQGLVLGLTGSIGSGCGEATTHLEDRKFRKYSLTGRIWEYAKENGLKIDGRRDLQDLGDKLRKEHGEDYLAKCVYDKINWEDSKIVIKSIRNDHEAIFLKNRIKNFFLINIDAPTEIRLRRLISQDVYKDEDDFYRDDERDTGEDQPAFGQHVRKCVDQADIVINNDSSKKEFYEKIDKCIYLIENPKEEPPTQMELNMAHAYRCSLNSTCLNRKVGAVIVNGNQIIASGYNDTPHNVKSCRFLQYCFRKDYLKCLKMACDENVSIVKDVCSAGHVVDKEQKEVLKKHLDLCQAIHAEERAILQVAKLGGQSLKDSVLYSTTFPCLLCAKKIIEVGVKEVVYLDPYPYSRAYEILKGAEVKLTKFLGVKSVALDKLF